jgi:hypothetical protein
MPLNGSGLFRGLNRSAAFQRFQEKKSERNQNNYNEKSYERSFPGRLFSPVGRSAPALVQMISPFGYLAFYSTIACFMRSELSKKRPAGLLSAGL